MSNSSDSGDESCSTLLDCPQDFELPAASYGTFPTQNNASSQRQSQPFHRSWAAGPCMKSPQLYLVDAEGTTHRYRLVPADIEVGQRPASTSSTDPSYEISESKELCAWVMFVILVVVGFVCLTSSDPRLGWSA
ncbi:hypothetical protein CABS01_04013 [Colletotrichum abscissum]|uniref:uncharacterized protein n=1 Tax=Colletotrichum abscissum TaxID=1671311 RepID=UPI0027D4B163|nr:uncharacterized protein CABS01_04013 [Colletotrichum abscissum]KAK1475736.1 hypothetical protein CABS01_04013 [Colletotrichum abscissum]